MWPDLDIGAQEVYWDSISCYMFTTMQTGVRLLLISLLLLPGVLESGLAAIRFKISIFVSLTIDKDFSPNIGLYLCVVYLSPSAQFIFYSLSPRYMLASGHPYFPHQATAITLPSFPLWLHVLPQCHEQLSQHVNVFWLKLSIVNTKSSSVGFNRVEMIFLSPFESLESTTRVSLLRSSSLSSKVTAVLHEAAPATPRGSENYTPTQSVPDKSNITLGVAVNVWPANVSFPAKFYYAFLFASWLTFYVKLFM